MLRALVRTTDDYTLLILRVTLGLVIFPHGAQKALGWFGGGGVSGTIGGFAQMGIPAFLTVLVILAESLGAVALVLGLLGRVAAFGIAGVMLGAIVLVHLPNGFFMNWSGQQAGEGYEYHLLALAIALALMIKGSGALSVDLALSRGAATGTRDPVLSPAAR